MTKISIANIKNKISRGNKKKDKGYVVVPKNDLVLAAELYEVDKKWSNISAKFKKPIGFDEATISEVEAMILHDISDYKIDTEKGQYIVNNVDKMKAMLIIAKQDKRLAQLSEFELGQMIKSRI